MIALFDDVWNESMSNNDELSFADGAFVLLGNKLTQLRTHNLVLEDVVKNHTTLHYGGPKKSGGILTTDSLMVWLPSVVSKLQYNTQKRIRVHIINII